MNPGWSCPACGGAHAPSVLTCPVRRPYAPMTPAPPYPPYRWPWNPNLGQPSLRPLTTCRNG